MSVAVESLPSRVDLATWDADVCHREEAYELVEGVPTMAPAEAVVNRVVGTLLSSLLLARCRGVAVVATDVDVTISEVPATVRRPDVVVARREVLDAPTGPLRISAAAVLLVAEVVSPSSVERDLVAKRRDYARAGIPAYLVVDLRDGRRELTLYAERDRAGRFVDVAPAEAITVRIPASGGDVTIPLTVDDILP